MPFREQALSKQAWTNIAADEKLDWMVLDRPKLGGYTKLLGLHGRGFRRSQPQRITDNFTILKSGGFSVFPSRGKETEKETEISTSGL